MNAAREDFLDDRSIDRLVDGELSEAERRALLLRLEAEPDGWRRCALAFLEAQAWRESFAPLVQSDRRQVAPSTVPIAKPKPKRRERIARFSTLTAGLLAAFALGWGAKDRPVEKPSVEVAKVEAQPESQPSDLAQGENVAQTTQPSEEDEAKAKLELFVKMLEQRGYQAELQKMQVSMKLQDGRKVAVPVQEIRVRYAGGRTY